MDSAREVSALPAEAVPEEAVPAVGDPEATGEPALTGMTAAFADPQATREAAVAGMTVAPAGVRAGAEDGPHKHGHVWAKLLRRAHAPAQAEAVHDAAMCEFTSAKT